MKALNILALTRYGVLGASSRLRFLQYLPWLQAAGCRIEQVPLLEDRLLQARYQQGGYGKGQLLSAYWRRIRALLARRTHDLLWIEKEALPWWPLWAERILLAGRPYVLDYDDAVFHDYDRHPRRMVRCLYGQRLDGLMAGAALVVAGNRYLAERARGAGAPRVEIVPTVIDLLRYPLGTGNKASDTDGLPRLVWIGSPATIHYLDLVADPLRRLARRMPFVLRVIGAGKFELPGVRTELLAWSEETECASVQGGDIGIMPLLDSPWEQGKCGYKLIQYMACGLPTVASAVGANNEIVLHGQTGMLVKDAEGWVAALEGLLNDMALGRQMGAAGRARVESAYCIQKTGPLMARLLQEALPGEARCAA